MKAMDVERPRDARAFRQPSEVGGLIDGVLGHIAVGRPLPAGGRQQA
jgi:hypothetical protein